LVLYVHFFSAAKRNEPKKRGSKGGRYSLGIEHFRIFVPYVHFFSTAKRNEPKKRCSRGRGAKKSTALTSILRNPLPLKKPLLLLVEFLFRCLLFEISVDKLKGGIKTLSREIKRLRPVLKAHMLK
jgi:hypothetical protein